MERDGSVARLMGLGGAMALVLGCGAGAPDAGGAEAGAPKESSGTPPIDAGGGEGGEGGRGDASADAGAPGTVTLGLIGSTFTLHASIAGGPPHIVQLDTGSIGLYVPRAVVGSAATVSTTETCSVTYQSSGVTLTGHAATGTIALLGASASGDVSPPPQTAPTTFCAVDDPSWSGGMMGVGFGRGSSPDPSRNVLLQVAAASPGTMRRGFALSTHPSPHVEIGAPSAAAFQTITLAPDVSRDAGDWLASSLRGCLTVPSEAQLAPACGPLLVDTGIAECLLWGPADPTLGGAIPSGQTRVPDGVELRITAETDAAAPVYDFTVGRGADAPSYVETRSAGAFSINTGRAILADYDYLFDAEQGLVGFRRAP